MMILLVDLEMLSKVIDPLCQYCNLYIRRAGVAVVSLELTDYLFFLLNA